MSLWCQSALIKWKFIKLAAWMLCHNNTSSSFRWTSLYSYLCSFFLFSTLFFRLPLKLFFVWLVSCLQKLSFEVKRPGVFEGLGFYIDVYGEQADNHGRGKNMVSSNLVKTPRRFSIIGHDAFLMCSDRFKLGEQPSWWNMFVRFPKTQVQF